MTCSDGVSKYGASFYWFVWVWKVKYGKRCNGRLACVYERKHFIKEKRRRTRNGWKAIGLLSKMCILTIEVCGVYVVGERGNVKFRYMHAWLVADEGEERRDQNLGGENGADTLPV